MTRRYPYVLQRVHWLLVAAEAWIASLADGTEVRRSDLRQLVPHRVATDDELLAVVVAFEELGILRSSGDSWQVDSRRLLSTAGYREGVREAFLVSEEDTKAELARLVVAFPPSIDPQVRALLLHDCGDLRSGLIDLIASAQHRIVLASPFWDAATTADLEPLLRRRIAAGVRVDLLGRSLDTRTPDGRALTLLKQRLNSPQCHVFRWLRNTAGDRFGTETFHLKVAIADDGARAYLGTANFTAAGLRSRMELGIVTSDQLARSLARMVDVLLDHVAI